MSVRQSTKDLTAACFAIESTSQCAGITQNSYRFPAVGKKVESRDKMMTFSVEDIPIIAG